MDRSVHVCPDVNCISFVFEIEFKECYSLKYKMNFLSFLRRLNKKSDTTENAAVNIAENILDSENVQWFSLENQFLQCKVIDCYDGDTITIVFPFGNKPYKDKFRLLGLDTAEIRTKNKDEKEAGIIAKNWLSEQILNKKVWIRFNKEEKYGRLMGVIYRTNDENSLSINDELIQRGLAYAYDGKKKTDFADWYNRK